MDGADPDYLESKRTVDDRARSGRVRRRLLAALPERPTVVDAGAGSGAMLRELLSWGVTRGTYRGVDRSTRLVAHAREHLPEALAREYAVTPGEVGFTVEDIAVRFERGDVLDLPPGEADVVTAQAVLDLVPPAEAVDAIERALRPGGLAYLPITFDGGSVFLPAHPDDGAVVEAYHAAIDATTGRDSRAGRRVLAHLQERDGELIAVDGSDWIVRPRGGEYPAREAHFLGCILEFVEGALADRAVDATGWLADRRGEIESASLTYVARNYDFLYRAPP